MVDWKKFLVSSVAGIASVSSISHAMSERDYKNALKIAQEKVERTRVTSTDQALSSSIVKAYFGRYYRVGDAWDVASWEVKSPLMNLAPVIASLPLKTGRGGIFHYEVKEIRNGATPEVVISVHQISDFGMSVVDPRVEEIILTMSDRFVQTEKAYRVKGTSQPIRVSPDGIRTRITPLELFALDVPDIATAEKNPPSALPELPSAVHAIAVKTNYQPNLKESTWLEQEDFFGRPVQILWQYGNPWPSYLKTSGGMSILIRTNTDGRAS